MTDREEFEAWMKSLSGYPFAGQFANLMWAAWQAARATAEQSTFALEMLVAGGFVSQEKADNALKIAAKTLGASDAEQNRDNVDAARYRWLRDVSDPGICAFYLSVGKAFDGVKFTQDTVDQAIDAQIAASESRETS